MPLLNDDELHNALAALPLWTRAGSAIERNFVFPSFAAAMEFVNLVAALAEQADHHPDIDIRYNRVKLSLTSHDTGGLTRRDLRLAAQIDSLDS